MDFPALLCYLFSLAARPPGAGELPFPARSGRGSEGCSFFLLCFAETIDASCAWKQKYGGSMFEPPKEQQQESSKSLWIGVAVVVAVLAGGALFYMSQHGEKAPAATMPAAAAGPADPVRDLKIQRATMDKDRTGTVAVWLVSIENRSSSYAYSNIQYETTYIGADSKPILVNQGTIPITIGPGEELNREVRDALYPSGTAWFKFKITGAKAAVQQ